MPTLKNDSHRTDEALAPLLKFVESQVKFKADIHLHPCQYDSFGYPEVARGQATAELVEVWVSKDVIFPKETFYQPEVGVVVLYDWREELVFALAHEFRHVQQHRTGRAVDEVDAETFAVGVLNAFRRSQGDAEVHPFPLPSTSPAKRVRGSKAAARRSRRM
jgi:hypothetical protein